MKDEIYWNYTVSSKGQTETWMNGRLEIQDRMRQIKTFDANDLGHYSSLEQAIKGFKNDELNQFSEICIEYDDSNLDKFKLVSEVYYDYLGNPVNDVVYRKWKKGEIESLTHAYIEAIFIRHQLDQGSVQDFAKIMKNFPEIKTK